MLTRGSPHRRLRITMLCIGFVLSLVAGRLVQLQAMEGSSIQAVAESHRLATIAVPAVRGSITSADGTTLAMTVQTDLVHADPPMITQAKRSFSSVASALAGPLRMTPAAILALLSHPSPVSPDYVVLKQSIPATTASRISALNLPGIAMTPSYTRVYPNGDLAANVVGFTNTTASGALQGEAGVEQSYNSLLAGRAGQQEVQVGTNGQPIPVAGQTTRQMVPGDNVRLTHRGRPAVGGRAGLRAGGQEDRRQQLHRGHHAARHGEDPGHGAVAVVQSRRTRPTWPTPRTCRSPTCSTPAAPPR